MLYLHLFKNNFTLFSDMYHSILIIGISNLCMECIYKHINAQILNT